MLSSKPSVINAGHSKKPDKHAFAIFVDPVEKGSRTTEDGALATAGRQAVVTVSRRAVSASSPRSWHHLKTTNCSEKGQSSAEGTVE